MDTLDYGRRFIVDGTRPGAWPPLDRTDVEAYLLQLHDQLEGGRVPTITQLVEDVDGFSAAACGAEAHVVLHLFPALGYVSLQVFSRRDVLLSDMTRNLGQHFGVGRFESHLGNATKSLPKEPERLRRVLAGDRDYARIRLTDKLVSP
jgi:S-adenosylmethionine decarboxylase